MAQLNPFDIFGIPKQFAVDLPALEEKYIQTQRKVHPDRFVNATEAEKRVAQQWSILLNEGYQKLKDPLARGMLLCEMLGEKVDENSSGALSEEFLMAQLERREEIDDALRAHDEAAVSALQKQVSEEMGALEKDVEEALDKDRDPKKAALLLQKMMFLKRQSAELMKGI